MNSKRNTSLGALVFTLLALAAALYGLKGHQEDATAEYLKSWLDEAAIRESVSKDGVTYRVERGIVLDTQGVSIEGPDRLPLLRLAHAKALARRSPLMALPGVDSSTLRRLTDRLEGLQEEIGDTQSEARARTLVKNALYPVAFLRAMAATEEARQNFLAEGTADTLRLYTNAQRRAIKAFTADLQAYRNAFTKAVPSSSRQFAVGDTIVTYDSMLKTMDALANTQRRTHARFAAREQCLKGYLLHCDKAALALRATAAAERPFVSAEAFDRALDIVYILKKVVDPSITGRPYTRLVALEKNRCSSNTSTPLYSVSISTSTETARPYTRIEYAGDLRFIDSQSLPQVPFYAYFAERDLTYIMTSPLLHYVCPEFGNDSAAVAATYAVSNFSQESPLSLYANGATRSSLRAQEVALEFTMERPVYEADARAYLNTGIELARTGKLPAEAEYQVSSLLLQFAYGSAGYEDVLQRLIDTDTGNVRILKKGVPVDLGAPYAFFFRSPLRFFFMAENPSVAGLSPLATPPNTNLEKPYLYYSKLPHSNLLMEKIIHDTRIYRRIHIEDMSVPIERAFER